MKSYGAIRKIMLMVLLSIIGSYCIGSDAQERTMKNSFDHVQQVAYDTIVSIGAYCHAVWSELVQYVSSMFGNDTNVKIQLVDDQVHGNSAYCTDGTNDCMYNNDFFNDTYVTGQLDEDSTTHWDVDEDPMQLVASDPELFEENIM